MARIYVDGINASLIVAPMFPVSDVNRHDLVLFIPLEGSYDAILPDGPRKQQREALVIAPKTTHSLLGRNGAYIYVPFNLTHPRFKALLRAYDSGVTDLPRQRFARFFPEMAKALSGELSSDDASMLLDALADELLVDVAPVPPLDPRIGWIMHRLENDIDMPFEHMAEELGVSKSRLSHLFTAEVGVSFRGYLAWTRLRRALELLVHQPGLSLAEVARREGFSDTAHLSRAFHSQIGVTPTMMRDAAVIEIISPPPLRGRRLPVVERPD